MNAPVESAIWILILLIYLTKLGFLTPFTMIIALLVFVEIKSIGQAFNTVMVFEEIVWLFVYRGPIDPLI